MSLASIFTMVKPLNRIILKATEAGKSPAFYLAKAVKPLPSPVQKYAIKIIVAEALAPAIIAGELDCLIGRRVRVSVTDADYCFAIGLNGDRHLNINLNNECQNSDAEIRLDTQAVLDILSKEVDPDTLFFQRRLIILGDMALGHEVKNILDAIEEDALSPFVLGLKKYVLPGANKLNQAFAEFANAKRQQNY